jgi:hypothetical protein
MELPVRRLVSGGRSSYIGNKPLSTVDPTGYEAEGPDNEPFIENGRDYFAECRNSNPSSGFSFCRRG